MSGLPLVDLVWLRARLEESTDLLADTLVEVIGAELGRDWNGEGGPCGPPSDRVSSGHAPDQCR